MATKILKSTLRKMIKEAIKEEKDKLDPVGKDEHGKKVGVGQIRDIDNDGDVDSSDEYLAYRRKKITQNMKEAGADEGYDKSVSWGEIPSVEELEELMGDEGFPMTLRGPDSLAFDYAVLLSDNPQAGVVDDPEGMHATLEALVDAPTPDELDMDAFEEVEDIIDQWMEQYGDLSIADEAGSLASSIMDVLGVEWI